MKTFKEYLNEGVEQPIDESVKDRLVLKRGNSSLIFSYGEDGLYIMAKDGSDRVLYELTQDEMKQLKAALK